VAFLRGETEPGLAKFWPYVFGAEGAADPEVVETYSNLMADSQAIVADDTLAMVDLRPVRHLMDVGGGTGAFLTAVGRKHPHLKMTLFDLPVVVEGATARFTEAGLMDRVTIVPGSFRDDALPEGPDAISLVRVLFDHTDATVEALLARVFAALPPGGRVIVSEAMGGGDRPIPATDVYFAFYCAAMQTGRVRSGAEIAGHLSRAGFVEVKPRRGFRPYVASIVTARKPGNLPAA